VSGIVGAIVGSCCSTVFNGQAASVIGGVANQNCFSSRSVIVGGFNSFICASSTDAVIMAGNSNGMAGAVQSTVIGGVNNRLCHASTFLQTGNTIINGFLTRICGCFNTNYNTIINTYSGCICSGSFNTLINGTNSCLMSGVSNSFIIGPCNVISGRYTGAVIIGSGITANANNTLFANNLCVFGSIAGTGCFVTTGQTGVFESTGYARRCFVTTGQTGAFGGGGGSSLCSGVNTLYESFSPSNIVNTNLINFDVIPNSTLFYTGTTTTNFYINLRGSSSCTFDSLLPLNNSLSVSFSHVNAATPYYLSGINIDGTARSVIWAGGGGVPSGVSNATNVYSITAFKTGNNSFRIFGSLGFFS
jgi:hypothetical protein